MTENDGWIEVLRGIVTERHIDFNKHVSVVAYFGLFDDGATYMLRRANMHYVDIHPRNLGIVTVKHVVRYLDEMLEGDPYVMMGAYTRMGRSSLRYLQKMYNERTGEIAATLDTIEAMIDFTARRSTAIPDDIRAHVEPMLVGMTDEDRALFGE